MLVWCVIAWVAGLLTLVPYGTYYLLYHAEPDQYALLITLVLFWIFGFWGVVGPVLGALKVRSVFRAIERARTQGDLMEVLRSNQTREVAIDFIASENRIPRFLAARVYRLLIEKLSVAEGASAKPLSADGSHIRRP